MASLPRAALLSLLCSPALAAIDEHLITSLPGWDGELPSRMWAGQIDIRDPEQIAAGGEPEQMLFYRPCEAEQTAPADSPVALCESTPLRLPLQCWWGRKRPSERVSFATFDVGTDTRAPLKTDEGQEVVTVAPGGDELKRCIASKAKRCHLLPGIHHESAVVDASRAPLEITGTVGETRSVMSGALPVPGPWTRHKGSIWKTQLPPNLRIPNIQQAWAGETWLPEARWPNANLTAGGPADAPGGPLSLSSWAKTYGRDGQTDNCTACTRLRLGEIVDPALESTAVNWTGALATLNVGFRFYTWTRKVESHVPGSDRFTYNFHAGPGSHVGGNGAYLDKGLDNRYFLSGKLEALDAPGEHFIDEDSWTMYVWAPDSRTPSSVRVKVKDMCVDGKASIRDLDMFGCAWHVKGDGLSVTNVSMLYPTFHKTIDPRNAWEPGTPWTPGPFPAVTTLEGDGNVVRNFHMRYAQNGGLKVVGNDNRIEEALLEDMTWLASLDFPPIELGFGFANPTTSDEQMMGEGAAADELTARRAWGGVGNPAPTMGNDNVVTRSTLRRMGEMGIVTSQRSNELSYLHVHDGGLIGLDHACVHADNTFVSCMNYSIPRDQRANCTKVWHHMWVHDCREKGVRGDDRNLNLTMHHLVVYNLGEGRNGADRNTGAATGAILKGDYNRFYANTVFNTSSLSAQGDLCAVSLPLRVQGGFNVSQQNVHSVYLNSAAKQVTGQGGPVYPRASFAAWASIARLDEAEMGLRDPANFDFRPGPTSPLRGAGVVRPPEAPAKPGGGRPDIGAYQADDEDPWVPGCTFSPACRTHAVKSDDGVGAQCGSWKFRHGYGPALPGAPSKQVATAQACCAFCHNTSGCKFWTWNGAPPGGNGDCYPKAGNVSGGGSPTMVSGGVTPGLPMPPAPPAPPPPPPPPSLPPPAPPQATAANGFVNVSAPPFNADSTGKTDVTAILQAAIDFAYDSFLVPFFPQGEYLVSYTLTFRTKVVYWQGMTDGNNTWPHRFHPQVALGERLSTDDRRPVIRLADNARNFQDPARLLPVVTFTVANTEQPDSPLSVSDIEFNCLFRGIDITIGKGTPGAIGIQHAGAQGSSIQDSTITVGSGHMGVRGCTGSGGSHSMLTVIGGQVGIDCSGAMNSPTLTGLRLISQTETALIYDGGLQALSVVGMVIEPALSNATAVSAGKVDTAWGQISMLDSTIDYSQATASGPCVAFAVQHSLYLRNVYLRSCGTLINVSASNINRTIPGTEPSSSSWVRAAEVAVGADITAHPNTCTPARMPIYRDGVERNESTSYDARIAPSAQPPADLRSRHTWHEATFPTWDNISGTTVDAKSFGAVGDGVTDDTNALQAAIDAAPAGGTVFIAKGRYRISRTLNLTGETGAASLVGTARHLTRIMPMSDGLTGMTTNVTNASNPLGQPAPLVHFQSSEVYSVFAMLTLVTWESLDSVYGLQWDNHHPRSTYRQAYVYRITECLYGFGSCSGCGTPMPVETPTMFCKPLANLSHPLNVITGSIMAYNFENEDFLYESPEYRHMLVTNNRPTDNVVFYQANFEHATSVSDFEIRNAHNVAVYSFKTEGGWVDVYEGGTHMSGPAVLIKNSTNVSVYSHGGNARARPTGASYDPGFPQFKPSLYRIEDSCPVRLTTMVDQFQFQPDSNWNWLLDVVRGGAEVLTRPCERPVLYERSVCASSARAVKSDDGGPALTLSILGPGSTPSSPARGTTVQLRVRCGGRCPPWVRIDRTDGVSDTTPFVRPVDEGYTFSWAPTFPHYLKPSWGEDHTFGFGGSAGGAPIGIVASGWTQRYNGTQLSTNSSELLIYYSTSFEDSTSSLRVDDLGPGSVRLTLSNTASVPAFGTVRFDRYFPNATSTASPPQFIPDFFFNEHSGTGSLVLTFQEPGVYYYGVTPTFQGRAGGASAGGVFGSCTPVKNAAPAAGGKCEPATHPTALVVTGPGGETGNQSVVPGFAGATHHLRPLRTRHQFCIFETNLTVFSGAQIRLPLCRPAKAEQPPQPGFISIIAPSWLTIRPKTNETCARCKNIARAAVALNSSESLSGGRTRYTFAALGNQQRPEDPERPNADKFVDGYLTAHWSTYNNHAPFFLTFGPDRASSTGGRDDNGRGGGTHGLAELSVMIHYTPHEATTVAVEKWQRLTVRCIETPRLKRLPKRLVTGITWASIGSDLMYDDGSSFWLKTYKHLGFNTVPEVSMPAAFSKWTKDNTTLHTEPTAPAYLFPERRAGAEWSGLLFGPQISNPSPSVGPSTCKKSSPNASLLPSGLTEAEIKVEMTKWGRAYDFSNRTGHLDVAYDGIFSKRASLHFCEMMKATQPDWVYIDDEAFGEGWDTWKFEAVHSANAQARALPGETSFDLAWRMGSEMLFEFTSCLKTASPKTRVHWYGYGPECPFPDRMFAEAMISMGPSEYGQPHYLSSFADGLREVKQQQWPMAGGKPHMLLPWLTSCTYGVMDAVQAWEEALHAFGSGATGFSFFGVFFHGCFDDPAKLLALSTATALATPFEDLFLEGEPLVKGAVTAQPGKGTRGKGDGAAGLRAWSGVGLRDAYWLVLTPGDQQGRTMAATLTVTMDLLRPTAPDGEPVDSGGGNAGARALALAAPLTACDLTTGKPLPQEQLSQSASNLTLSRVELVRTSVLHVAPRAAADCEPLPPDVWLPEPGYNY